MKIFAGSILALALFSAPAAAQSVNWSGTVTPGHLPYWVTNGVIGDAGNSSDSPVTSIGATGPICSNSDRVTAAGFNSLCLQANTNSPAVISIQNTGTAPAENITFLINGAAQGFPTVSPLPTVIGNLACFSTTGGGLQDCGVSPTTFTITGGSTPVANILPSYILYNNAGFLGGIAPTGTGNAVLSASPTFTGTPVLSTPTATSLALGGATIGGNAFAVTGTSLFNSATTFGGALTYGGVALNNAVTGTGNMVLSASPTLSGTIGGNLTLSGNTTESGQGIFTGTSAPASASGNTVVMGTIGLPVLADNGQAFFYNTALNGASVQGRGTTYDSSLLARGGSVAVGVSTGTIDVFLGGKIQAASISTSGTIGGSICRTAGGDFIYSSAVNCFQTVSSVATAGLATGGTITSTGTITVTAAAKSDQTTATSNTVAVTPLHQQEHPSAVKAYGLCIFSGGTTYTLNNAYNVTGANCGRTGVGTFSLTFTTAFTSTTTYQCAASLYNGNAGSASTTNTSGSVAAFNTLNTSGSAVDVSFQFVCFGTQ